MIPDNEYYFAEDVHKQFEGRTIKTARWWHGGNSDGRVNLDYIMKRHFKINSWYHTPKMLIDDMMNLDGVKISHVLDPRAANLKLVFSDPIDRVRPERLFRHPKTSKVVIYFFIRKTS